ncbi:MAG: GvpL/GvpF family gas vesicle protein [Syntrophomonas sp.]
MGKNHLYVYGILEEPSSKTFDVTGVKNNQVYTVNYHELAAVVSSIKEEELDPTRKNLLAHTGVQELLLHDYTFLPMSFGVIVGSINKIEKMLEDNYLNLKQELERLAEKIEVEIKVYWNKEAVKNELANNHKYEKLSKKIAETTSAIEKQNLLIETGKLVEEFVLKWQDEIGPDIYSSLKSLAVDACMNNSNEITNILNASFLVKKNKENEFQDKLFTLDVKYQNRIEIKYISPLPPYNFLQVELKGE